VQRLAAQVGHPRMQARQLVSGFSPPRRGCLWRSVDGADSPPAGELSVQPTLSTECRSEGGWVGSPFASGQNCQVLDTYIHPDRSSGLTRAAVCQLDLAGERTIPAASVPADCRRQDSCGPPLNAAGEFSGGLVGPDSPKSGQGYMVTVSLYSHRAGGESARLPPAALSLTPREAHGRASPASCPGVCPVLQSPSQRLETRVVGFLGVVLPPRSHRGLRGVPLAAQRGMRPWHLDLLAGRTLVHALLDQLQTPVIGEPRRACVRSERALLTRGGSQGEPVPLVDDHAVRSLVVGIVHIGQYEPARWRSPLCQQHSPDAFIRRV
jgi:hypothetical protein